MKLGYLLTILLAGATIVHACEYYFLFPSHTNIHMENLTFTVFSWVSGSTLVWLIFFYRFIASSNRYKCYVILKRSLFLFLEVLLYLNACQFHSNLLYKHLCICNISSGTLCWHRKLYSVCLPYDMPIIGRKAYLVVHCSLGRRGVRGGLLMRGIGFDKRNIAAKSMWSNWNGHANSKLMNGY